MWNERIITLIGEASFKKLNNSRVAVFGVGGVGSYAAEALVRSGIGNLDLIDGDEYCESNINRQLYADLSTLGVKKTEAAKKHLLSVNPECNIQTLNLRFNTETTNLFPLEKYDYVIDAIDSLDCKALLIKTCMDKQVQVVSSMGAGNRTRPECLEITDIYSTKNDPLAKEMRKRLKKLGVDKLKVVCSTELPKKAEEGRTVGSICTVTAAAGMFLASVAINELIKEDIK